MQRYRDTDGESSILAYESGPDYLRVQFSDGSILRYTTASVGPRHLDEMQRRATEGEALEQYLTMHAKNKHAMKER